MRTAIVWTRSSESIPVSLDPQDVRYLKDCHSLTDVFDWLRRLEPQCLAHVWISDVTSVSLQDGFQVRCWGPQGI